MRLLRNCEVPEAEVRRTFRTSPLASLAMLALFWIGTVLLGRLLVVEGPELPTLVWVVLGPLALIAALVLLVVDLCVASAFLASLNATNWVLKTTAHGIYLQLRSYQNWKIADDENTAVYIEFDEIVRARRLTFDDRSGGSDGETRVLDRYLELELRHADTAELAEAVRVERMREGAESNFLGIKSKSKAIDLPVTVGAPDIVRVTWRGRGMLSELAAQGVECSEPETLERGVPENDAELEDRILELLEVGRKIDAVALVRQRYGLSLTQARTFVEDFDRDVA